MTNREAIERLKYAHFHFRNEINEVEIKSICGTDELKEFDLAISALEENTKLKAEIEQLKAELEQHKKFKEYFTELYGQGLEVANWHLNGDTEPLDIFIDSAIEAEQHLKGKV